MKLIFLDIDNTLCPFGTDPSPETMHAIRLAQRAGHRLFLCTGRAPAAISPVLWQAGFDGVIAAAGAYAEVQGEKLLDQPLEAEESARVRRILEDAGVSYVLECYGGNYAGMTLGELLLQRDPSPETADFVRVQSLLEASLKLQPLQNYPDEPVYKFSFFCPNAVQMETPSRLLSDQYSVVFQTDSIKNTGVAVGELIPKDCNKGTAVHAVAAYYQKTMEDVVAFGDSPNDLPMFEAAGFRVVMGNAGDTLKQIADYVAPCCTENGVAKALAALGFCGKGEEG